MSKHTALVDQIRTKGLLKGVSLQVYEIVANKPGLTVGEMASVYLGTLEDPTVLGRSRNELAKRVSDLVGWGAIKVDGGKTLCPYTGRKANRYVVTGNLPTKEKPVTETGYERYPARNPSTTTSPLLSVNHVMVLRDLVVACDVFINKWYIPSFLKKHCRKISVLANEVLLAFA